MNKPNYTAENIELRVASMEESCAEAIEEGKSLPMTATVIPEIRWLFDRLKRKGAKKDPVTESTLADIEQRLLGLEKKRGAIRAGKFIRIPAAIIADMRYLLDGLGVKSSEHANDEDDLWQTDKKELATAE